MARICRGQNPPLPESLFASRENSEEAIFVRFRLRVHSRVFVLEWCDFGYVNLTQRDCAGKTVEGLGLERMFTLSALVGNSALFGT
jgi:hypothetical protein